jgi:ribosomal protein L37AE/L43A
MNKASQLNTITTVPHEVWLDIFLFCDTRTLCSLGLACKKFNKVFQDDWIWREKIRIEYPTKNDTYNQEFQIPIYHPAYVTFRSRWATATIDSKNAKHFEGICTICKKTDYRMKREELAKYQIPIWRCSACRGKAKELTKLQYYITKQERDMLSTFGTPPVVDSVELSMFETLVVLPSNSMRLRERIILAKQEKKLKKKSNSLLELKEVTINNKLIISEIQNVVGGEV